MKSPPKSPPKPTPNPTPKARPQAGDGGPVDAAAVFHALGEPTRLHIVRTLIREGERPCGEFDVDVSAPTLSHHFKLLRNARIIRQQPEGYRRINSIDPDFVARYPLLHDQLKRMR